MLRFGRDAVHARKTGEEGRVGRRAILSVLSWTEVPGNSCGVAVVPAARPVSELSYLTPQACVFLHGSSATAPWPVFYELLD